MESKDGVRAAFRQWNSAQRSPHRTSSFHHIRRSNQPCFYKCSISLATLSMDNSMVQPSAVRCCCLWNGWYIAPFALCPALPDSLVGRYSHDYYGAAASVPTLVIAPPTPFGEL